jgi:hypothetical protein
VPAFAAATYAPTYPSVRHLAFIAINLACAWLIVARPRWFVFAYALLMIQVLNGHGAEAWRAWRATQSLHVVDLLVSVGVVLTFVLLVVDAFDTRTDSA